MRRVPGTALVNAASGEVIYTPPVGESLLRDKLADRDRFIHDSPGVDPVVRMAVAHYQFGATIACPTATAARGASSTY